MVFLDGWDSVASVINDVENQRLGQAIRAFRLRQGLQQQEFAARCGLSQSRLSKLELGQYWIRGVDLQRIAERFAVSVDEILALTVPDPTLQTWLTVGARLPPHLRRYVLDFVMDTSHREEHWRAGWPGSLDLADSGPARSD